MQKPQMQTAKSKQVEREKLHDRISARFGTQNSKYEERWAKAHPSSIQFYLYGAILFRCA